MKTVRYTLSALLYAFVFIGYTYAQTDYTWGGGTGTWDEPTNWSPNGVPGASDYVTISTGTVSMLSDTEVSRFTIEGSAAVAGSFDLTVTDSLIWAGGATGFETFRDSGDVIVTSAATMRLIEPSPRFQVAAGRTIVNNGTTLWENNAAWQGAGRFVNNGELRLLFESTDAFGFVFSNLADALTNTNNGLLRWMGSGEGHYVAGLVNDGVVRVENGTLRLHGFNATGTSGGGAFEVQAGATLKISGANHSASGDPGISGDGVLELVAGTLSLDGSYNLPVTRFNGGGTLNLNGDSQTDSLSISGGKLAGSGVLTVTDDLNWSGGTMGGSGMTVLGAGIPVEIGGANIGLQDTRTLRVEGTTTWTGDADFSNGTGATYQNAGTLISTGAGDRQFFAGNFVNEGVLVHDTGSLAFSSGMSNTGRVTVESGSVKQQGFNATGGTDTGVYELNAAARLEFTGGVRTLTDSAEVVGNGTVVLPSSNFTNNATWRPGPLPVQPGGIGVIAVDGAFPVGGVLEIGIGGPVPGVDFDQFSTTGAATLGGTLNVTLLNSFVPSDGDRFLIIPATGGASGQFAELNVPAGIDAYVDVSAIGAELVIGIPVSNEKESDLPKTFALQDAYPNPFNPQATIGFDVPQNGEVNITMFDALGRHVKVLASGDRVPGRYTLEIDGSDLSSGVYLVRMTAAGGFVATRQVVLLK